MSTSRSITPISSLDAASTTVKEMSVSSLSVDLISPSASSSSHKDESPTSLSAEPNYLMKSAEAFANCEERNYKGPLVEYYKSYTVLTRGLLAYFNGFTKSLTNSKKTFDKAVASRIELESEFKQQGEDIFIGIDKGTEAYTYFQTIAGLKPQFEDKASNDEPNVVKIPYQKVVDRYLSLAFKSAYRPFQLTEEETTILYKLGLSPRAKGVSPIGDPTPEQKQTENDSIEKYLQSIIDTIYKKDRVLAYMHKHVSKDFLNKDTEELFLNFINAIYRFILECSCSLEVEDTLQKKTLFNHEIISGKAGNPPMSVFDLRAGQNSKKVLELFKDLNNVRKTKNPNKLLEPFIVIMGYINNAFDQLKQTTYKRQNHASVAELAALTQRVNDLTLTATRDRTSSVQTVSELEGKLYALQQMHDQSIETKAAVDQQLLQTIALLNKATQEQKALEEHNIQILADLQAQLSQLAEDKLALAKQLAETRCQNRVQAQQMFNLAAAPVPQINLSIPIIVQHEEKASVLAATESNIELNAEIIELKSTTTHLQNRVDRENQVSAVRLSDATRSQAISHQAHQAMHQQLDRANNILNSHIDPLKQQRSTKRYAVAFGVSSATSVTSALIVAGVLTISALAVIPVVGWAALAGAAAVLGAAAAYKGISNYLHNNAVKNFQVPAEVVALNVAAVTNAVRDLAGPQSSPGNTVAFQSQQSALGRLSLNRAKVRQEKRKEIEAAANHQPSFN